jgi:Grx4 family monothiol glutaredoxin
MEDVPKAKGSTEVRSVEELEKVLATTAVGEIAILNFYTKWAAPCEQMNQSVPSCSPLSACLSHREPGILTNSRVFQELAGISTNKTLYISIDAESEACADLTETYDVSSVPHFVFLKDGTVLHRVSGADPQLLRDAIEKYAGTKMTLPPLQQTSAPDTDTVPEPVEHINVRLGKLVKAAPVMLFMKGTPAAPECGFSRQLVSLLRKHEIRYGFFNILADDEVRQGLKTFSYWPTYPQLYCRGTLIGGLDIVSFLSRQRTCIFFLLFRTGDD